jgi:Na+/alanine symporter
MKSNFFDPSKWMHFSAPSLIWSDWYLIVKLYENCQDYWTTWRWCYQIYGFVTMVILVDVSLDWSHVNGSNRIRICVTLIIFTTMTGMFIYGSNLMLFLICTKVKLCYSIFWCLITNIFKLEINYYEWLKSDYWSK